MFLQKQNLCQCRSHNNINFSSPLAWKVWCNYIRNIGEPLLWRGPKKELTAWAWQLVDHLQPPTASLMALSDAPQSKQSPRGRAATVIRPGPGPAGDSTSNMDGVSSSLLMCLFISKHIRAECAALWTASGFHPLPVNNGWTLETIRMLHS